MGCVNTRVACVLSVDTASCPLCPGSKVYTEGKRAWLFVYRVIALWCWVTSIAMSKQSGWYVLHGEIREGTAA